ncbi:MAG: TrkA family potassium uptake protein [Desulforhabdus sp.]|nr:TrkA family potassium uptake protein [Desulforhabdus sp.]
MNILIVGGEKLVYFLSRLFFSKGHTVTVINRDRRECTRLARRLKGTIVHGDGSDLIALEEAGARSADAVLAATPNDEDNLVICQLASLHFAVPRTLALVNDPDNEEVFQKLQITSALSVTRLLAGLIEQTTEFDDVINLFPAGEGKLNITQVSLKETSPVAGKTLMEIALPESSLIASIMRNGEPIVPRGPTELLAGDRLILITLPKSHGSVLKRLTGG